MADVEAKVARLLDEYRVALNKGRDAGVEPGATATVWRIVDIKDPDTDELLDTIRVDAVRLEILSITAKVSVARIPPASALSFFGFNSPGKRIVTGPSGDTSQVRISVGDEVTVRVPDAGPQRS